MISKITKVKETTLMKHTVIHHYSVCGPNLMTSSTSSSHFSVFYVVFVSSLS